MKCFKCNADMEYDSMSSEFVPTTAYEFHLEKYVDHLVQTCQIDEDEGELMFSLFFDCEHEVSRSVAYVLRDVMDDDDRRVLEVQ